MLGKNAAKISNAGHTKDLQALSEASGDIDKSVAENRAWIRQWTPRKIIDRDGKVWWVPTSDLGDEDGGESVKLPWEISQSGNDGIKVKFGYYYVRQQNVTANPFGDLFFPSNLDTVISMADGVNWITHRVTWEYSLVSGDSGTFTDNNGDDVDLDAYASWKENGSSIQTETDSVGFPLEIGHYKDGATQYEKRMIGKVTVTSGSISEIISYAKGGPLHYENPVVLAGTGVSQDIGDYFQ